MNINTVTSTITGVALIQISYNAIGEKVKAVCVIRTSHTRVSSYANFSSGVKISR